MTEQQHQQWAELITRLAHEGEHKLAATLADCITEVTLRCQCCFEKTVVTKRCSKRWCPLCQPRISAMRLARCEGLEAKMQWPLFITLTSPNYKQGEAEAGMQEFKAHVKSFRGTVFWNKTVLGGVQAIEVTNTRGSWHIHVHVLADCRWLAVRTPPPQWGDSAEEVKRKTAAAQQELTYQWGKIVGIEKPITWVRRAKNGSKETLKYSISPDSISKAKLPLGEIVRAIDAGRLMTKFGSFHGVKFEKPESMPRPCEHCGQDAGIIPERALIDSSPHDRQAMTHRQLAAAIDRRKVDRWMRKLDDAAHVNRTVAKISTDPDYIPY